MIVALLLDSTWDGLLRANVHYILPKSSKMKLRLYGHVRLLDKFQTDVTPRSKKAVALLALLVMSHDQTRSRRWCEAMLWPDATPEKASSSLRQVVHILRTCVGDAYVISDRTKIRLCDITRDHESDAQAVALGHQFMEDVDIDESEFNNWLATHRAQDELISAPPKVRENHSFILGPPNLTMAIHPTLMFDDRR